MKEFKSNIPLGICAKVGRNLHLQKDHPLSIVKNLVLHYLGDTFSVFQDKSPYVSVHNNFDVLLVPQDHPCRKQTDSYYLTRDTVLRTHTSAHQVELLLEGHTKFLVAGDVYRKDEVDKTHYPVFHQLEGVCLDEGVDQLKQRMMGLAAFLFPDKSIHISADYFPFTDPSFEVSVRLSKDDEQPEQWLEIAGCGLIRREILEHAGYAGRYGWAFGLGLERLAMALFEIPDIRLFWSQDPKFLSQFREGTITSFTPFSNLPTIVKDLSFYVADCKSVIEDWPQQNDFFEVCREVCGDLLEQITLFDRFENKKTGQISLAYHLRYHAPDTINDSAKFTQSVNQLHHILHETLSSRTNPSVTMR